MFKEKKSNDTLPDGRRLRTLEGIFNQKKMFALNKSGLFDPATETIMSVKECDQHILHSSRPKEKKWWRTGEYAFYPRGFEKEDIQLGKELVYVENGVTRILNIPDVGVGLPKQMFYVEKGVTRILNIPDVGAGLSDDEKIVIMGQTIKPKKTISLREAVAMGIIKLEIIGLREAVGMGIIRLEKLEFKQIDEKTEEVSVTTDFDPQEDVRIVDVMRPKGYAYVDADGIPLKSEPSGETAYINSRVRYSHLRHFESLGGSTGYHGSLARAYFEFPADNRDSYVYASCKWSLDSKVTVVERSSDTPQDVVFQSSWHS